MIDSRDPNVLARRLADLQDELDTERAKLRQLRDTLGDSDAHRTFQSVVVEEAQKLRAALYGDAMHLVDVIASFDEAMAMLKHFEEV